MYIVTIQNFERNSINVPKIQDILERSEIYSEDNCLFVYIIYTLELIKAYRMQITLFNVCLTLIIFYQQFEEKLACFLQ